MSKNLYSLFSKMTGWECARLSGPEAKDFLQRLTTANFKRLFAGQFTPAALLQATGKMITYFKALMLSDGSYLLLAPPQQDGSSSAQAVHDALERMHFRENFTITPVPSELVYFRALGLSRPQAAPALEPRALAQTDSQVIWLNENKWNALPIQVDYGAIVQAAHASQFANELQMQGFSEAPTLEPYRIQAGDPAWPQELNPSTMPLEARLDDAVHENKGCYPGQEVIERVRSMGQPSRLLVKVRGQGLAPLVSSALEALGAEVGALTSVAQAPYDQGWVGLGYVKRVALKPDAQFAVSGQAVSLESIQPTESQS